MKIGVDFGTTRVVVAAADRGNYPVVSFETSQGETYDWFPPVIGVRGDERRYGFEAWDSQDQPGWTVVRSIKRLLAEAGLDSRFELAGQTVGVQDLLRELAQALCRDLRERSTLSLRRNEEIDVMLGVPANANSNQRFLTAEAFRQAGVRVLGILNEPSAASIELGHRLRRSSGGLKRSTVVVYDFGGGTFDASVVDLDEQMHEVIDSEGISSLGGDDFDEILADMALEAAGISEDAREGIADAELFRLQELCRIHKEGLHPNSRRISLDLESVNPAWTAVTVPVTAYFARCQPLVERTVSVVESLLTRQGPNAERETARRRPETVYVIGGASELPIVGRRLRDRYGRYVRRSPYGRFSTAIGLAIQADEQTGYILRDRFTRYFGVWREGDGGASAVFDPLFERGTELPRAGETALSASRTYRPTHNLGHFRFLECSSLAPGGQPAGDILHWDEIHFPFVPALTDESSDLKTTPVHYDAEAANQEITETVACDASGSVVVTLANVTSGYSRRYPLGHRGSATLPIRATRRRKS